MQITSLPPKNLFTLRILWAAITCSTLMFLLVLTVAQLPPQTPVPVMVPAFGVTALGCIGAGIVIPRMALKQPAHTIQGSLVRFQTAAILGLALTEAVALFGFVLGYLGFAPIMFMPFFVVAWLIFILRFPRATHPLGMLGPSIAG
jgi:hypothetical protein